MSCLFAKGEYHPKDRMQHTRRR